VSVVRAAGGLLWREDPSGPRIALVHRPRRSDWSLPKGKLDDRESWEEAALREVQEETGCEARITGFAGAIRDEEEQLQDRMPFGTRGGIASALVIGAAGGALAVTGLTAIRGPIAAVLAGGASGLVAGAAAALAVLAARRRRPSGR
jgi:ADP-ribose pyrophosphatase YjhB (NUDIX family)